MRKKILTLLVGAAILAPISADAWTLRIVCEDGTEHFVETVSPDFFQDSDDWWKESEDYYLELSDIICGEGDNT